MNVRDPIELENKILELIVALKKMEKEIAEINEKLVYTANGNVPAVNQ